MRPGVQGYFLDRGEMDRIEAVELTEDARHRFGEVSKERPEPNKISLGGILGGEGCEIRVAVETIRPDRHRQECPLRAEHDRPGVNCAGEIDEESPAQLAKMPWSNVANEGLSHPRMDPVGADDEVVSAGRTVCEHHVDLVIVLTKPGHGRAEAYWDAGGPLQENTMKLTTSDANARADCAPHLRQFDFRQLSSGVIQDSLVRQADGSSQHLLCQTKRLQRANAVSRDIQAGTARWP